MAHHDDAGPMPAPLRGALGQPAARYHRIRQASEDLVRHLSPEDMAAQSMPDASPAKWHLVLRDLPVKAEPGGIPRLR